ncbi:hypothetical protein [Tenacibaculum sp. IB213877]|uniref:hypothetical protein n=1 Tax=Tenacibaculum sp. IB213877 TaxID=3097351 RepID=UPI002A5A4865|nr:hypothetical protein [Tenacibaculum sp. IB213877]MDY0779654.1 hypothetical protein [Tenacibaculum sp. IB213877]
MKINLLNITGTNILSKQDLQNIFGGAGIEPIDLTKCGCDCAGNVTGPKYCSLYFGCPQVYDC